MMIYCNYAEITKYISLLQNPKGPTNVFLLFIIYVQKEHKSDLHIRFLMKFTNHTPALSLHLLHTGVLSKVICEGGGGVVSYHTQHLQFRCFRCVLCSLTQRSKEMLREK